MRANLYDIIEGNDILQLNVNKTDALVEGMIYPNDYILLVAEEKVGKTIFAQQLASNMTTGKSFLGIFDIPKPLKVWYFATEGKAEDLKDRFIRMNKSINMNTSNVVLIPTFFRFNTQEGVKALQELLIRFETNTPDIIIVDALYRAIKGSIKNDDVVNDFHHIMGWLMKQCDCAIVLIHHMTKPQRSQQDGSMFQRSDKDTFGSAFLSAAVDHIFWLEKWGKDKDHKNDRILKCDTQRSGNILNNIRIRLIEPDPLYFEVVSKHEAEKHRVRQLLQSYNGLDINELQRKSRVSRTALYIVLKELQNEGAVIKSGGKVKIYSIKK
tara:strand:+ start:11947 stop:12921 length:975 start_codon:yes stop_codon:yes gene_type:complete